MHNSTSTSQKPLSAPTPSNAARALLGVIRAYQRLRAGRIAPCRFYPRALSTPSKRFISTARLAGALSLSADYCDAAHSGPRH